MSTVMDDVALLNVKQAARYLGVSRSYFFEHVRPYIAVCDMRRPGGKQAVPRWTRADLDAFIAARRKERKTA